VYNGLISQYSAWLIVSSAGRVSTTLELFKNRLPSCTP
jgi:hypothetical protein